MEFYKKYVDVIVKQTKQGNLVPLCICWENGKEYHIDKVVSQQRHVSQVGGCGMRFICMIQGRTRNLYLEKNRWFIESVCP